MCHQAGSAAAHIYITGGIYVHRAGAAISDRAPQIGFVPPQFRTCPFISPILRVTENSSRAGPGLARKGFTDPKVSPEDGLFDLFPS